VKKGWRRVRTKEKKLERTNAVKKERALIARFWAVITVYWDVTMGHSVCSIFIGGWYTIPSAYEHGTDRVFRNVGI